MKNRLSRLLKVLEWYPRTGVADIDALALQLGTTPATVRRDLRDLREAGAFDGLQQRTVSSSSNAEPSSVASGAMGALPAAALEQLPANDGPAGPAPLSEDELVAMYVGARFLAAEGDPSATESAQAVIAKVEHLASPALLARLAEIDTRYRFGPRGGERRVRRLVQQAITERRVLAMLYKGERDRDYRPREVEPLAQFFIHDRWSFYAYCRTAGDIRQFRHERCKDVRLTDQYFTDRGGFSLEGFIRQRRRAVGSGR